MHSIRTLVILLPSAILLTGSACVRSGEANLVAPAEPSYFAGYVFQPKPISSSQTRVLISLCDVTEPTDIQVNVYDFGPDTNGDENLDLVLHPGSVPVSPGEVVFVRAKYTDAGMMVSDYNREKRFAVAVARNGVSVLMVDRADGTKLAGWVMTTGKLTGDVCLKKVSGRGGRLIHKCSTES